VADRFHLLKNFGQAVERVLRRHAHLVRQVPAPDASRVSTENLRPDRRPSREGVRQEMSQRFDAIRGLKDRGCSIAATARTLGLHRHTVEKYWPLETAPERRYTRHRPSALAPYEASLQELWWQGQRKARSLWRALVSQGYTGDYENVARFVAALKRLETDGPPSPSAERLTPRQAVALTVLRPERRTLAERRAIGQLKRLSPEVATVVQLVERFAQLLRERTDPDVPERFERWMTDTVASGHRELVAFVRKLRQDHDAVRAAFELPYSQGQIEGQITRLKALKRAMSGRANFDLLRKRFLAYG
jgi:transposase